uniref:Fatty acid hydroxylase domain-containing protein n=1 Tax=Dunaliella tertiolecta TaxID=3047 RepID=A0A7S3VH27_DUNTE|eukprot:CAMPEP_0202352310 /NCGR_PEP_ID=MMETSP1126-20121109/8559_1 /ASSEMBLY_ACC=CAM_ASM_000457 /TAXON_ID=3047 /ORGANISM="Dunaliella tertiolecta, Strain CCMP1320" /LENGTH=269 /DNA_ID=CAMNT_0048944507 /DNA_START=8 /DNA_END=817 /DNA_ORIENTATION=-
MMDMLSLLTPLYGGGFVPAFAQLFVFYYVVGALLHWGIPLLFPVQSVQPQPRAHGSVARDAFYSLGPMAVKAAIWVIVEEMHARGWNLLYTSPINTLPHVLYCSLVVGLLDYLHDSWFYWTHRMLHWGPLYKHIHYIHHKSKVPSAFTGYSFHVIEALIVFANEVFVTMLFPMPASVHRVYHLVTTAIHEGGHAGYEIAPFIPTIEGLLLLIFKGTKDSNRGQALNTVQHHDMHHRFPTRHFSLYFTHWDRWFGTMHPQYEKNLFSYFK